MAWRPNNRRRARVSLVLGAVAAAVLVLTTVSSAQLPILPTPTPSSRPTRPPEATLTPPPSSPTPKPTPQPSGPVPSDVVLPGEETPDPKDEKTGSPKPSDEGKDAESDELPEGLEEELVVPNLPRTRPRNTVELVGLLRPLTKLGISLDQVLVQGMGRFPVAGLAHYYDDWLNPRFTPKPHLHKGLDIFADFGTPIRSPDRGVVTSLPEHGAGGIAVWVRGQDGVEYYFAHMLERVDGIHIGQRVDVGTVLGFVGDTGNARGGTPHLHFEIHRGGHIPPKPTVDAWLDEAEDLAPAWVKARLAEVERKREILGPSAATITANKEIEASMLLTLLDPVGGSVGLLPSLELAPRRGAGAVSDRLFSELVGNRVEGRLFLPSTNRFVGD